MSASIQSGCSFSQPLVDQRPRYDGGTRKRKWSSNQAMSKKGMIRADKRRKVKYL